MFLIAFQMTPSLLILVFFAFGDVLSEEFLQGPEDQLAMESYQYQIADVADIPNYSQKAPKELHGDRIHHKRKSEQKNKGRNWNIREELNRNLGPAKSEMNCSIPFTKLEHVNCHNSNDKKGYEIYTFVDSKGAKKLINEDGNIFDPQRILTKAISNESPSKSDVVSHVLKKRLSSNAYKQPFTPYALRNKQRTYSLNPKTALNSQSITVHVLPPDPNYSANVLSPQSRLASNNINKVSSYVDYNLPSPIFRNIMNENGQLVQQFIDAKPIPHNSIHHHQHSPITPRVKQSNPGPAYYPVLLQQHHHLNQGNPNNPQPYNKNLKPIRNNENNLSKNIKSSKLNAHKIKNSPESSYSKSSSNPSNYQQSHNSDDEEDSHFNKRVPHDRNHHNFRKEEINTDPRNSQELYDDHYNHHPDDEQSNSNAQTDESITRGPDYTDSEEDNESRSHNLHAEQEHPTDEDNSSNHSQESNDYDDDPPKENDQEHHQHNKEGSSPSYEQRQKYDDNEDEPSRDNNSSQEVRNSYDGPNSSEDTLPHDENLNNPQQESSDRAPKHHEDLNKFFYGNEKNDDDDVKHVNLVDEEEIENDKIKYHKMKQRQNNDNNHDNLAKNNVGNFVQIIRDKSYYAKPHHSNHNGRIHNHYPQNNHASSQSNNILSSNGHPLIKDNKNVHNSQQKIAYHPQNIVYSVPQLYQLNSVVGNSIPVQGNNVPHQHMYLPNNQVYNTKPLLISNHQNPNNGNYRNDAKIIPHHILLKQSNIPLTFHQPHQSALHSNSDNTAPNIYHGSNHVSSISNKNIYNDYDPKKKNYYANSNTKQVPDSSRTQINSNQHNQENNDDEGYPNHQSINNIRFNEDPSSSEVNRPSLGNHNDRKYKEEQTQTPSHRHYPDGESSNEESNPNHPLEEDEGYNEEDASSTEVDTPNSHIHDDDKKYRDDVASSNEEEIPDRQRLKSSDRSRYNNDDAASNEEENPTQQQSKKNERINSDDESSQEAVDANHSDNDDELTSNDEDAVEDQEDDESSDNKDEHQPKNDRASDERDDQKFISSDVSKQRYNNNPTYEDDREGDEQLSQEEKKNLFEKHFENEFGITPSSSENSNYHSANFDPSMNAKRQNLHKTRARSRHNRPSNEEYSETRRSFDVKDKNLNNLHNANTNKFVVAVPARQDTNNLSNKVFDVNTKLPQRYLSPLGTISQAGIAERNQLSQSYNESNQTSPQISKIKIPQFESFGDFFLN